MKATTFKKIAESFKSEKDSNPEHAIIEAKLGNYYVCVYGFEDENFEMVISEAYLKNGSDFKDIAFTKEQEAIMQDLLLEESEKQIELHLERKREEEIEMLEYEDDLKHQRIEGYFYDKMRLV